MGGGRRIVAASEERWSSREDAYDQCSDGRTPTSTATACASPPFTGSGTSTAITRGGDSTQVPSLIGRKADISARLEPLDDRMAGGQSLPHSASLPALRSGHRASRMPFRRASAPTVSTAESDARSASFVSNLRSLTSRMRGMSDALLFGAPQSTEQSCRRQSHDESVSVGPSTRTQSGGLSVKAARGGPSVKATPQQLVVLTEENLNRHDRTLLHNGQAERPAEPKPEPERPLDPEAAAWEAIRLRPPRIPSGRM
jgi:hypothetical protein